MNLEISNCIGDDEDMICQNLVEYNISKVPATQKELFVKLSYKITDENGHIIAGCMAKMYCWNVVYLDMLWVDGSFRGAGLGLALLEKIEGEARKNGCSLIHLDTFDFQAKEFYQNHGYQVFGVLEDCPPEHCRYYLKKKL